MVLGVDAALVLLFDSGRWLFNDEEDWRWLLIKGCWFLFKLCGAGVDNCWPLFGNATCAVLWLKEGLDTC